MAYHHGDLRRTLIEASLEIVRERGADSLSLREAARQAGVSSGAPYKHFASKEELLSAVAARALEEQIDATRVAMSEAGASPLTQFRAQGVTAVRWAASNPELFRLLHRPSVLEPGSSPEMTEVLETSHVMFGDGLSGALEAGELGETSPAVVALTAQALIHGLCRLFVDGHMARANVGPEEAARLAEAATGLLGVGLLPRGDGP